VPLAVEGAYPPLYELLRLSAQGLLPRGVSVQRICKADTKPSEPQLPTSRALGVVKTSMGIEG